MHLEVCPECKSKLSDEMREVNMCWECGCILDESLAEGVINTTDLTEEQIEDVQNKLLEEIIDRQENEKEAINKAIEKRELEEKKRRQEQLEQRYELEKQIEENIINHMITTTNSFEGYEIVKYLGVVSGSHVIGTGLIATVDAVISDAAGAEVGTYAKKIDKIKLIAQKRLIEKSVIMGGNAVIGVDFDYLTFSREDLIGISANGTSVILKKR